MYPLRRHPSARHLFLALFAIIHLIVAAQLHLQSHWQATALATNNDPVALNDSASNDLISSECEQPFLHTPLFLNSTVKVLTAPPKYYSQSRVTAKTSPCAPRRSWFARAPPTLV